MLVLALTSTSSPGPIFGRGHRELQRGGTARHRDAVLRPDVVGEAPLECRDRFAERA